MFPAATFVTVPGAGHWVHADKPNELLEILQEFILKGNLDISWVSFIVRF